MWDCYTQHKQYLSIKRFSKQLCFTKIFPYVSHHVYAPGAKVLSIDNAIGLCYKYYKKSMLCETLYIRVVS